MKILHISRPNRKAAGVIAYTLHQELLRRGHESRLLVRDDFSRIDEGVIGMYSPLEWNIRRTVARIKYRLEANCPDMFKRALGLCERINSEYCPHSLRDKTNSVSSKSLMKKFPFQPDVIILYFIYSFVNAQNISDIYKATKAKILWVLPDMAAMTGGCHYAWDCEGYKQQCGKCPALSSDDPEDISYHNIKFKEQHLQDVDLTILGGSEWNYRQALESALFKNRKIFKILAPVDENVFKPGDKTDACKYFGISPGKKVIFFGARSLRAKRKGIQYLLDSLKTLKEEVEGTWLQDKIHLLIAGRNVEGMIPQLAFDYTYAGLLSITKDLPKAFQAADLFACPSVEDSGPMMVNQAIMSGTPVVAFEMGVALDLVHTGVTGYRARLKDSADFAKGMKDILSLSQIDLNKMRKNCRRLGLSHITASVQGERLERILKEQ